MSTALIRVERRDRAAWVTLQRPDAANAMSRGMIDTLRQELDRLRAIPELVALVITGAGERAFCAGADLRERQGFTLDETRTHLTLQSQLMDEVEAFPRAVIAAINGAALGGGLELALACDIRVAAEHATLGLPEVRLGIIPGAGGTQRLARICGVAQAKDLILSGRRLDASTAARLGLVSAVVPPDGLQAEVERRVAELSLAGPLALAQAKRALDGGWGKPLSQALAWERECYEVVLGSADRDEGLRAFAEKRAPRYQGR